MRIAILYLRILVGGVERVLDGILSHLSPEHEVAVFTEIHHPTQFDTLDSLVKFKFDNGIPREGVIGHFIERRRLSILLREVIKWHPDVILVNGSRALRYTHWLSIKSGIPTVVYFHSFYDVKNIPSPNFRNFLTRFYRIHLTPRGFEYPDLGNTRLAICVSKAVENMVRIRFPQVKTTVIYNGVDHESFTPTWEDENYALCISRFSPEKNLEILVRALCSSNHSVVFYGTVGREEISSKISYFEHLKSYNCRSISFEVHNDQSTMIKRLQKCSIFLYPGKNEGFGLAPLEAMACGKVVLAHHSGGTPECVDQAGYLLGDSEYDWRKKVDDLMQAEALRKELGMKAYEHSKQFTWEKTAKKVEEVLESVMRR